MIEENFKKNNLIADCVFCKIINKEIPAKIILENDYAISFLDASPTADGHTLVIPKYHCKDLANCPDEFLFEVSKMVKNVASKILNSKLDAWGVNYLSNQGNVAGQEVFHFHFHVIPKYVRGEGFGFSVNKVSLKSIDEVYEVICSTEK